MDDYYRILDVSPDAPRDDIRAAYKSRRDQLDARGTDESRAEAARLNRAWNVLSDPTQRERYDDQLARARAEGDVDLDGGADLSDSTGSASPAERPKRRRLFESPDRAATPQKPTIEVPEGMQLAGSRSRLWAMGIDLAVLVAIAVAFYIVTPMILRSQYPDQIDRLDALIEQRDDVKVARDDAEEKADEAKADAADAEEAGAAGTAAAATAAETAAKADVKSADAELEKIDDEAREVQGDFLTLSLLLWVAPFLIGFAYLVIPSARGGQTVGKRLRRVRVVGVDGSPIGWRGALVRYGLPVAFVMLAWFVAREFAVVLALFGITRWMRNPNQQGMHDRLAKTIVVEAG